MDVGDIMEGKRKLQERFMNRFLELNGYDDVKIYNKGEFVCFEGESCKRLLLIVEGTAEVIPSSLNGKNALVDVLSRGDFIGDIEFFDEKEYVHSVRATSELSVVSLDYKLEIVLEDINILQLLLMNFTLKLRSASISKGYSATLNAKERLALFILKESNNNVWKLDTSFINIAKSLNISTRHLRRLLRELEEEEIISYDSVDRVINIKKAEYFKSV
jgi:CRP-like cAMP-binding protein